MFVQNKEQLLNTLELIKDAIEQDEVNPVNIYQLIEILSTLKWILVTKD